MTPGEVVRTRILAITAVTALVGARVYSVIFPQKPTWPSVRVQDVGQVEDLHLRGASGVIKGRVQVDVVSGERSNFSALDEARNVMALIHGGFAAGVATGLLGFSGSIGGSPGVQVDVIEPIDYRERFESEEIRAYLVSRDYRITLRAA